MLTSFVDVQQNSPEWFDLRLGKITGSKFGTVMANYGKAFGNPALEYADMLALERAKGERIDEGFSNQWMDRGHELEPVARREYELFTFDDVTNGGIFISGDYAVSPDGCVGDDGLIEIKCVKYTTHMDRLRKGGIDLKYKWQIQGALWLTDTSWCDFISYCPEMTEAKQLYICRVYPDPEMFEQLEERLHEFNLLVTKTQKLL